MAGFAVMVRVLGVVVVAELTASQFPVDEAVAEKVIEFVSVLFKLMLWVKSVADPGCAVKLTLLALKLNSVVALTTSVTGIVCGVALPEDVTETAPVYVPAVNPAPFMLTVTLDGVVPEFGVTLNQPAPSVVVVVAVNPTAPLALLSVITWPGGACCPIS